MSVRTVPKNFTHCQSRKLIGVLQSKICLVNCCFLFKNLIWFLKIEVWRKWKVSHKYLTLSYLYLHAQFNPHDLAVFQDLFIKAFEKKLISIQKFWIHVYFEKMNCMESQINPSFTNISFWFNVFQYYSKICYRTLETLHKKWSFLLRISPKNLTKSVVSRRFGHIFCVKSVQILCYFWSVSSRIQTEYGQIRSISPYSVQMWENTDQKKLRIWTLSTQWFSEEIHIGIFHLYALRTMK